MGNTLTGLIPVIYKAVDLVSRELVGMIPAVTINASEAQGAVGQEITSPVTAGATAVNITPGPASPDTGDQAIGKTTMSIQKSKMVPVNWTGEEQMALNGTHNAVLIDQFSQAFRTITNEVESDLAGQYIAASRAYGTAGTTPFGTPGDFTDVSSVVQILKDNGAPVSDLQLVVNTTAGANLLGKHARADIVGEGNVRRLQQQGVILALSGCQIRESAQIRSVTKGTGIGYLSNNVAGYPVGATALLLDTGTGTVLAGDVVTFAGDTNKYIVGSALVAGNMALNPNGLRKPLADNVTMTVGNNYSANMAFARSAIHLLARTPAMPKEGDQADDVIVVTDPVSGLAFQIAMYRQYRRVHFEIGLAWGTACTKSEHLALLLG